MNEDSGIFLSIVIPAFNEEGRVGPTIGKILQYCDGKDYSFEIIVVDDGSCDNTSGVVENMRDGKGGKITLLKSKEHHGKGFAVKEGVMSAGGEYILFCDADLSTPIEEVEKLMPYLKSGYSIAIGSRGLADSEIQVPQRWYRQNMGRVFNKFVQCMVIQGIEDTQCGFKCFRREAALDIFPQQKIWGFCFDVEVLYHAQRLGYRIKEVPVVWRNSLPSRVSLLRHSIQMFRDLIKISIRSRK